MVRKSCLALVVLILLAGIPCAHAQVAATLRMEKNSVMARGRWNPADAKPDEDRPLLPLVEIHCFKQERFCISAAASVQAGEPHLAVEYYQILHWSATGITAENENFTCTTNELKIDFQDSNVTAADTPKKSGKAEGEACRTLVHTMSYKLIGERREAPSDRIPAH